MNQPMVGQQEQEVLEALAPLLIMYCLWNKEEGREELEWE